MGNLIQWQWRKIKQCVQSAFFVSLAFFGSTDGKGVTHRTSVWLPEREGSGSALSEARRGSNAWSQWVTDPLTDHVQLGDTPLEKHNKPASLLSSWDKYVQRFKRHIISYLWSEPGHMWGRKKKGSCLRSWKWYPDSFKDWVQITSKPGSLTSFCNFLQMRPFEVNWSQGCGMPCTFIVCV